MNWKRFLTPCKKVFKKYSTGVRSPVALASFGRLQSRNERISQLKTDGAEEGYQNLVSAPLNSQLLRKILKERFRLDKVGSGEPFSEPRVNLFQGLFCLFSFPLTLPQAAQTHRSPEFP